MTTFKEEHEKFIAGHNGTSYLEVAMLTSISCLACFLRDLFFISSIASYVRPKLLAEFLLLIFPNILSVSLLENYLAIFILLIFSVIAIFCFLHWRSIIALKNHLHNVNLDEQKKFITYFRSVVIVCTAIAILAVDFPVFPRRFAKTETFGFGGMDIGVGLFVVANAIVSPEARNKYKEKAFLLHHIKSTIFSCLPLIFLGVARLVTVKSIEYHEHVTEYGVHWNFFFTLAALKILLTALYWIVSVNKSTVIAFIVLILHQSLLSNGFSSYIIIGFNNDGTREGLIDANREGIYSLPGYIAIYMFGVQLGRFFFQAQKNLAEWLQVTKAIAVQFILFTLALFVTHSFVEPASRRLANASFVFWVMSVSCLMILQLLLADIFITFITSQHWKRKSSSLLQAQQTKRGAKEICILKAVNYNSLFIFLLANIMTGLVNMAVTTHRILDKMAIFILTSYMLSLCYISLILYNQNFSLKLT
ncbi:phosphatidylinositol-glycan biosynthesis class W protein [Biomphalaria pfeifferi]|uniref:Phosphatidylinositol-glycan biosynthesis class W protein n=1 Tax=Biomphalaria pfeifferi TaxID=112525 RepID=A0AAD8CC22_BIOPF|nr:phosphatidylinositol-glycan biosynthesis class W protein [Biomphalaria pfeifferi]